MIKLAHEEFLDENRKVKFDNLKYDLSDLYDNLPPFDEPVPIYSNDHDFKP